MSIVGGWALWVGELTGWVGLSEVLRGQFNIKVKRLEHHADIEKRINKQYSSFYV